MLLKTMTGNLTIHARVKNSPYSEDPDLIPHERQQTSAVVDPGPIRLDAKLTDPARPEGGSSVPHINNT